MIQIFLAGRDGRTGPTEGSTRGPRGPKNNDAKYKYTNALINANIEQLPFTVVVTEVV